MTTLSRSSLQSDINFMLKQIYEELGIDITSDSEIKKHEYELRYRDVSYKKFRDVIQYLKQKSHGFTSVESISMDIAITSNGSRKRMSLTNRDDIQAYCVDPDNIVKGTLITKNGKTKDVTDPSDPSAGYDLRLGIALETPVKQNSSTHDAIREEFKQVKKNIRYKNRISFYTAGSFRCDLTIVKELKIDAGESQFLLRRLSENVPETFEVEVEFTPQRNQDSLIISNEAYKIVENIWKILHNFSSIVFNKKDEQIILTQFINKLYDEPHEINKKAFPCPNVMAFGKGQIGINLNDYYVTKKIDGLHGCVFIYDNYVFIINQQMEMMILLDMISDRVKNISVINPKTCAIFEGEIIGDYERIYIYDILYADIYHVSRTIGTELLNKDFPVEWGVTDHFKKNFITSKTIFSERYIYLYDDGSGDFKSRRIPNWCLTKTAHPYVKVKLIENYVPDESKIIDTRIVGKRLSEEILRTESEEYPSDGIILIKKDNIYPINDFTSKNFIFPDVYKYKPMSKLSIDFQIIFNGLTCLPFNNVNVNLYARGDQSKKPFNQLKTYMKCDISGKLRAENGDLITNKCIVECIYSPTDANIKWTPIKVRYDKRDANHIGTARSIFELMKHNIDPFSESVYYVAGKKELVQKDYVKMMTLYHNHVKTLLLKKAHSLITGTPYVPDTKGTKGTKDTKGKKLVLADFACGRGGDFRKYIDLYSKVLGIDYSYSNLFTIKSCAQARASEIKSIKFDLICGDLSKDPIYISNVNQDVYLKRFQEYVNRVDVISCQFAIHYMFGSEDAINSFIQTAKTILKPNGLLIITCINAEILDSMFNGTNEYDIVSSAGTEHRLIKFTKKYDEFDSNAFGQTVEVILPHINQDPIPEYLVPDELLRIVMNDSGFEIIESENFFSDIHTYCPQYILTTQEKMWSYLHKAYIFRLSPSN